MRPLAAIIVAACFVFGSLPSWAGQGQGKPPKDPPASPAIEPAVVVDSTGAIVGQYVSVPVGFDTAVLIPLDDGRVIKLSVFADKLQGRPLYSEAADCSEPLFTQDFGITSMTPFAGVGPGPNATLYVQPDVSAVETINVASVLGVGGIPDQCVQRSFMLDVIRLEPDPFQLDFVPPFTVAIPPLDTP